MYLTYVYTVYENQFQMEKWYNLLWNIYFKLENDRTKLSERQWKRCMQKSKDS